MEDLKPDKYNFSKRPLNFRPRADQKEFIIALLEANAGSQQKAIEHCVTIAMDPTKTITITKENAGNTEDLQNEIARLKQEAKLKSEVIIKDTEQIGKLQAEIVALKAAPKPSGELKLSDAAKAHLDKIKKSKKYGTDQEAIAYALNYTFKNDWL